MAFENGKMIVADSPEELKLSKDVKHRIIVKITEKPLKQPKEVYLGGDEPTNRVIYRQAYVDERFNHFCPAAKLKISNFVSGKKPRRFSFLTQDSTG